MQIFGVADYEGGKPSFRVDRKTKSNIAGWSLIPQTILHIKKNRENAGKPI